MLTLTGNIYLTNYRIIVIAHPRHVLTCDQLIHKSFPISMLLKMEKVEEKIRADSTAATLKEVTFHRKVWQFVFSNFQVPTKNAILVNDIFPIVKVANGLMGVYFSEV